MNTRRHRLLLALKKVNTTSYDTQNTPKNQKKRGRKYPRRHESSAQGKIARKDTRRETKKKVSHQNMSSIIQALLSTTLEYPPTPSRTLQHQHQETTTPVAHTRAKTTGQIAPSRRGTARPRGQLSVTMACVTGQYTPQNTQPSFRVHPRPPPALPYVPVTRTANPGPSPPPKFS